MVAELGKKAKQASYELVKATKEQKTKALVKIAQELKARADEIIEANKEDLRIFDEKGGRESMRDRLTLTRDRIFQMADGVLSVNELSDPIGEILSMTRHPNGMFIAKKCVPLGVIAIIYEARPNVTVDAAVLCLKTSNACILRGGSEAINSNIKTVEVIDDALKSVGFPDNAVQLVCDTSRESAAELMTLNDYVDVLIPRGGAGLIKSVVANATVPVIETGSGNCHIYVEGSADIKKAVAVTVNAKVSRPSVCNSAESLLIDKSIADTALPEIYKELKKYNVELRGCARALEILPEIQPATEEDFYKEYNDLIMSVKIVAGIDEAIAHINEHGTGHSEAIIAENKEMTDRFLNEIDAAAVYSNASTRFTDGFEFGFGAEIGISTQKLHARGPMGLCELTSVKYIIYGDGQIR